MADSLELNFKTVNRATDPKTDRAKLSGVAAISVEYGDLKVALDVPFHDQPSYDAAAAAVLRQVGNFAHFMEYQAGEQERQATAAH